MRLVKLKDVAVGQTVVYPPFSKVSLWTVVRHLEGSAFCLIERSDMSQCVPVRALREKQP